VSAGATVHTDAWQGYRRLAKLGYDHQLKSLRAGRFLGEDVGEIVPRAHRVISNLKAWLQGTYHGVSGDHLQFYLGEFVFRFLIAGAHLWLPFKRCSGLGRAERQHPTDRSRRGSRRLS
jgi:hypothetical protein